MDIEMLGIGIDTSGLKAGQSELRRTAQEGDRAADALDMAGRRGSDGMDKITGGAGRARTSVAGLSGELSSLRSIMGALAIGKMFSEFVQAADSMTNLESRIRLTMKATEDYAKTQRELLEIARGSVTSLNDVGTLYARIAPSIQRLGGSQKEALGITQALTDSLRINGATTAESASAIIQFSQAMQSGILRGEEFNALNENAGPFLDALAKSLGKTRGELRGMAFDGLLTAGVVANGILPAVGDLSARADSMGTTSSAAFQDLQDAARLAAEEINKSEGVTNAMVNAFNSAEDAVSFLKNNIEEVTQVIETGLYIGLARVTVAAGKSAAAMAAKALADHQASVAAALAAEGASRAALADQAAAKAALDRARAAVVAAESEVLAERNRQLASIASIKTVQAAIIAENALEQARFRAQITDQGRQLTIARMAELRTAEIAIIKQVQAAETQLAATTVATAKAVQAAYAQRAVAAETMAAKTGAANAAVALAEKTSAAASATWGLASAGRSLLGVLGGPAGLAVTVGMVALSFVDFGKNTDDAADRVNNLIEKANELGKSLKEVNRQDAINAIRKQEKIVSDMRAKVNGPKSGIAAAHDAANSIGGINNNLLDEIIKLASLKSHLDKINADISGPAISFEPLSTGLSEDADKVGEAGKKIASMLAGLGRQVATFNMSEFESLRYELLQLRPSDKQLASFDVLLGKLEQLKAAKIQIDAGTQIADLQAIQRLALDGMAIDEARARVEMQRKGYNADVIDALLREQSAVDALKQAEGDRAEAARAANEIVKEMADQAKSSFDAFMSMDVGTLGAGFDRVTQSMGTVVDQFQKLIVADDAYAKARKDNVGDAIKLAQIEQQNQLNQMRQYGNLAGAAKGFFREGSRGYKTLEGVEKAYRIAELAMNAKAIAEKLLGISTVTAATVAGEGAKASAAVAVTPVIVGTSVAQGQAAAVAGVANQAAGDPYTAFPRMAAMAAIMAALGFAVGGFGSSKTKVDPGNTGTGTVFGDADAQSASIQNSIEYLADAATLENRISSQMLASLRNIEANIGGLTNLIIRTGGAGDELAARVVTGNKPDAAAQALVGAAGAINTALNVLSFNPIGLAVAAVGKALGLDKVISSVVGKLFGTKTKITGQGLFGADQDLTDVLSGGFELQEYVDLNIKKKKFGVTTSNKNRTRYSEADDEIERQFSLIFDGFYETIRMAAGPLGVALGTIDSRLADFVVSIGKINLKGLSGEEIQEKLEAVFGQQADLMAKAAMGGLDDFQQVGEGYFETMVRVASGIEQAATLLDRLGLSAIAYTDILYKQGDVAAEIIRQSVLLVDGSKGIAGGFYEIVGAFDGTGEEIADLVLQLRDLQNQVIATGKAGQYLTTFMIAGAGGADRLTAGLGSYFDDYLTDAERVAELTRRMTSQFNVAGQVLPGSIDAYRELVAGIDISTEAGQRLYGQIIALAPGFKELQDAMASMDDGSQALKDSLVSAFDSLRDAISQAESDLRQAYSREAQLFRDAIKQFGDLGQSIRSFVSSLTGAVDDQAETTDRLQAQYDALIRRGKLGDVEAMGEIASVGNKLKDSVLSNAGSAADAAFLIAKMQHDALAVVDVAIRQKTVAELQLDALNLAVAKLIDIDVGQVTAAGIRQHLDGLSVGVNLDAIIAAVDANSDGVITALEAQRAVLLGNNQAGVTAIVNAVAAGTQSTNSVKAALAGIATDAAIASLIAAVDTNGDGQITSAEANAAKLVTENQAVQEAVRIVAGNTLSVEQATASLKQLQSFENKAIADAIAAGLGDIVIANGATLSAIQQGTLASQEIKAALAGLLTIQQQQEADRQAELARQAQERQRLEQIAGINAAGQQLKTTVTQATAGRASAVSAVDSLEAQAYALASSYGVYLNAKSGPAEKANTAQFNVNDAGLFEQIYGQITYTKNAQQAESFKAAFYAPGGIYDQMMAQAQSLQGLKSTIDGGEAELQRRRNEIIALGGIPQFAKGGTHAGGLRLVGERGPELEVTGPSRIYSASQTSSLLDTSSLREELRQLRQELRQLREESRYDLHAIAKHTEKSSRQLERWDGDGMPQAREDAA